MLPDSATPYLAFGAINIVAMMPSLAPLATIKRSEKRLANRQQELSKPQL